jgi:hypothetical protein
LGVWSKSIQNNSKKFLTELNGPHCTEQKILNLNTDFEIQQLLGFVKHVINIIIWIRDTGCHNPVQVIIMKVAPDNLFYLQAKVQIFLRPLTIFIELFFVLCNWEKVKPIFETISLSKWAEPMLAVIKYIYLPLTYLHCIQDIKDRCILLMSFTSFIDLLFQKHRMIKKYHMNQNPYISLLCSKPGVVSDNMTRGDGVQKSPGPTDPRWGWSAPLLGRPAG